MGSSPRPRARHLLNVYEVKSHRSRGDTRDGNSTVDYTGPALRQYARHLEQNHDIARGALDRLTQFVVGPSGIGIEPAPKTWDGETNADLQQQLLALWRDWIQWPDVTWGDGLGGAATPRLPLLAAGWRMPGTDGGGPDSRPGSWNASAALD